MDPTVNHERGPLSRILRAPLDRDHADRRIVITQIAIVIT